MKTYTPCMNRQNDIKTGFLNKLNKWWPKGLFVSNSIGVFGPHVFVQSIVALGSVGTYRACKLARDATVVALMLLQTRQSVICPPTKRALKTPFWTLWGHK